MDKEKIFTINNITLKAGMELPDGNVIEGFDWADNIGHFRTEHHHIAYLKGDDQKYTFEEILNKINGN